MIRSVPAARVNSLIRSWKPSSARTMPMLVSAGSASTHATSPWASSRSSASASFHSTTRVVSVIGTGGPTLPAPRPPPPLTVERRHRLVDRAVVAVVEDEDLRPAGDLAAEPQREAVRVGRGEAELPVAQAEAPRHLLADRPGVLARQHRRDSVRHARRG